MVRLTERPDMTLGVYRGRKTTTQQFPVDLGGGVGYKRLVEIPSYSSVHLRSGMYVYVCVCWGWKEGYSSIIV